MDKRFLAIVGIIVVLFVGFLVLRDTDDAGQTNSNAEPTNHVKGENTANIVLTEFADFQCPACAQYYPVLEQVVDKYGEEIAFQFRHFPLVSIHRNAFAASRAAEAAGKQGKFWEMYDLLFAGQSDWSTQTNPNGIFETYAKQIELDVAQYNEDFKSAAVNDAINADRSVGEEIGITGTPSFTLNGEVIQTPPATLEAFSEVIDEALATN